MERSDGQKVSWVIKNITREPSLVELATAVRAFGSELFEIIGDYTGDTIKALTAFAAGKPVVFDGSLNMCELVLQDVPSIRAIGTAANYACSRYYGTCGDLLFNDAYAIMPLAEVGRNPVVKMLSKDACVFVRPDAGQKQFQAGLVELDRLSELAKRCPESLVVVSSPKIIGGEWRFVCDDTGIVAHSSYRIKGKSVREQHAPDGGIEVCRRVLSRYQPDGLFIVDVCADDDGNFWLMELNQFTGAGLYACDKAAVVRAVDRYGARLDTGKGAALV